MKYSRLVSAPFATSFALGGLAYAQAGGGAASKAPEQARAAACSTGSSYGNAGSGYSGVSGTNMNLGQRLDQQHLQPVGCGLVQRAVVQHQRLGQRVGHRQRHFGRRNAVDNDTQSLGPNHARVGLRRTAR